MKTRYPSIDKILKEIKKPTLIAINKDPNISNEEILDDFYEVVSDPMCEINELCDLELIIERKNSEPRVLVRIVDEQLEIQLLDSCDRCAGTGQSMEMVCYGDMPIEKYGDCPDCESTGFIYPYKKELKPKDELHPNLWIRSLLS
jgi:hypothetical protein